MARLCERPGCKREATVVFGFQADQRLVWVDAATPDQVARYRSGALCKEHADRLSVPRGWYLEDRRQPVPQLFRTPSGSDETTAGRQPQARRRRNTPKDPEAEQVQGGELPSTGDAKSGVDHSEARAQPPTSSLFDNQDRSAGHLD